MELLANDFKELLKLFAKHNVDYMLVGGYAVAIHGYPRYTGDMDLWVRGSQLNAKRIVDALREFGMDVPELNESVFTRSKSLIEIGREPMKVEIMNHVSGVGFDECFTGKIDIQIGDFCIYVLNRDDLIRNKKASGRMKDLADVEELEKKK